MLSQMISTPYSPQCSSSLLLADNLSPNNLSDDLSNVSIPEYPRKSGKWTMEEDDLLRKYVKMFGEKQWRKVSQHIPGRTSIQCLHRWSKILRPGLVKGPWTPEEDEKLIGWVKAEGPNKWAQAASYIPGRSGKQCRERWFNNLSPEVKKTEWTKEEDELLFDLYQKYGSSWSKIAKLVPGRTENSIKNRFYSTFRKINANRKKYRVKGSISDPSHHEDEEVEEEASTLKSNGEETNAQQFPHTLYKLLKENAVEEDEHESDNESQKEKESKGSPVLSEKIRPEVETANSSLMTSREPSIPASGLNFNGEKLIIGKLGSIINITSNQSPIRTENTEKESLNRQSPQKVTSSIDNGLKINITTKKADAAPKQDNLVMLNFPKKQIQTQFNQEIRTFNIEFKSQSEDKRGSLSQYKSMSQDVHIPSLVVPPLKSKKPGFSTLNASDLSNPIQIKREGFDLRIPEINNSLDKLDTTPLAALSELSAKHQKPLNLNVSSVLGQPLPFASSFGGNRLPSLPSRERNDMRLPIMAGKRCFPEDSRSSLELFQSLQSKKELSQGSQSTQSSACDLSERLSSFMPDMQRRTNNELFLALSNNSINNAASMQNANLRLLQEQRYPLEELLNIKNQLLHLEALNEISHLNNYVSSENRFDIKTEASDIIQRYEKRALAEMLNRGYANPRDMDIIMKKVKL